jgi:hypothetical protein
VSGRSRPAGWLGVRVCASRPKDVSEILFATLRRYTVGRHPVGLAQPNIDPTYTLARSADEIDALEVV